MGKRRRSHCKAVKAGKKDSVLQQDGTDRISRLPDDILCSILSLITVKDAVTTGLLSSRWRDIWTSLPKLNFTAATVLLKLPDFYKRSARQRDVIRSNRECMFVRWVDGFLQRHVGTGVKTFTIHFCLPKRYACHVDQWISFAISSGTEELTLKLSQASRKENLHKREYDFPCHQFAGGRASSLMQLFIGNCNLRPPPNFDGFSSLKVLSFDDVFIIETDFHNILSRCSFLDWLEVRSCGQLVNLKIDHSSFRLKYLKVECCLKLKKIEISAINLAIFCYEGEDISFIFENVPSLVRVSFSCDFPILFFVKDTLARLACNLPQLETLNLDLLGFRDIKSSQLPPSLHEFMSLKYLTMSLDAFWNEDLLWVASILNAAPFIEKFQLLLFGFENDILINHRKIVRPPKCPHYHLREVLINGFGGVVNEIELLIYILNNATALKSMTVETYQLTRGSYCPAVLRENQLRGLQAANQHLLKEAPPGVHLVIL